MLLLAVDLSQYKSLPSSHFLLLIRVNISDLLGVVSCCRSKSVEVTCVVLFLAVDLSQ